MTQTQVRSLTAEEIVSRSRVIRNIRDADRGTTTDLVRETMRFDDLVGHNSKLPIVLSDSMPGLLTCMKLISTPNGEKSYNIGMVGIYERISQQDGRLLVSPQGELYDHGDEPAKKASMYAKTASIAAQQVRRRITKEYPSLQRFSLEKPYERGTTDIERTLSELSFILKLAFENDAKERMSKGGVKGNARLIRMEMEDSFDSALIGALFLHRYQVGKTPDSEVRDMLFAQPWE